jgi:acetyl-CoA synthetase
MAKLDWESTDRILKEERIFTPSCDIVEKANITRYMRQKGFSEWKSFYEWSLQNPEIFWTDMAHELHWFKPWSQFLEWNPPYAKFFLGGKTNICYNCVDRHMGTVRENKPAFYWEGENGDTRTLTYRDLYRDVNRFAGALKKLGIQRGDRVGIYMPRIPEIIVAMLACARLGAIHSVVFSAFSATALKERLEDAEAKALITADGYFYRGKTIPLKETADKAAAQCPTVKHTIVAKRAGINIPMQKGRDFWWDELVQNAPEEIPCEAMDSEDPLYILYTSGTTGKPKGAVHIHGGYMVGIYATLKFIFDFKEDDIWWCTADPGWVTGHSYIIYGPLCHGISSLFYEGAMDYPDPGKWWELVQKYKVTLLYTAPTAIRALMRHGESYPARYNLSSLRLLGSVGEPINPEAWIWYRKVTGNKLPIMDTWWMTETGMQMISPLPITPLKPGSASHPFPTIKASVVTKEGKPVPTGQGGYLVIENPWPAMFRTVYKDPARYETYWNTIPGKYFSGDACSQDADGYFWIQGRVDDVIKKAGHRLGSMEIESSLVSHPAVAEAAVIGKPDPITGEAIKAFVILKKGGEICDDLKKSLENHVRETVGPIAVPDEIAFVDSLPKTRSGKIMRRLLKARETGEAVGDLSTLEE